MSDSSLSSAQYEYKKEEFTIRYDLTPDSVPAVVFRGKMRLESEDEGPISELLARVMDKADKKDRVI